VPLVTTIRLYVFTGLPATASPPSPQLPQAWADTFISELNDTHIEADLRLRHTPPDLNLEEVRGQTRSNSVELGQLV
jgi:hypothetical protein